MAGDAGPDPPQVADTLPATSLTSDWPASLLTGEEVDILELAAFVFELSSQ